MAGPRPLELGLKFGTDDRVERVVVDVQRVRLLNPPAQRCVGRKAGGLSKRLFNGRQHSWGKREGLASRHVQGQQGVQAGGGVAREPVADGLAMHPQELGHGQAALRLPAGQPRAHLEPWLLTAVMFPL